MNPASASILRSQLSITSCATVTIPTFAPKMQIGTTDTLSKSVSPRTGSVSAMPARIAMYSFGERRS